MSRTPDGAERVIRGKQEMCQRAKDLLDTYSELVTQSLTLRELQFQSVVNADVDGGQYQDMIDEVNDRKENAKIGYINHLRDHRCAPDWMQISSSSRVTDADATGQEKPRTRAVGHGDGEN